MGGGIPKDIGFFLKGGCTGGVAFRVGDVGPDPSYGAVPGQFPAQVCAMDNREAAEEAEGRDMVVSSDGGSDGGGEF